jgi:hypothetical protein
MKWLLFVVCAAAVCGLACGGNSSRPIACGGCDGPPGSPEAGLDAKPDAPLDAPPDAAFLGSCGGTITCAIAKPTCPSGEVPTIENACWTGNCEAISFCDVPPACSEINDESDCSARSDCEVVSEGLDCTTSNGLACQSGDSDCTCASYVFASCASKG